MIGMAIATTAMTLAATATSAVGQIYAANAQASAMDQQAENERFQALLNERRAGEAQEAGEVEASRRSIQLAREIGGAKAAFAGNGLLVEDTGTVGGVNKSLTTEARQDIGIISTNTARQVWGYEANATSNKISANSYNKQASATRTAGKISAAGTLLQGLGSSANSAYSGYRLGSAMFS